MMKRLALLSLTLLHFAALESFACSLIDGYLKPSNYDLVKETGAIVLAEASGVGPGGIRFRILQVLKGDVKDTQIVTTGTTQYLGKSDELNFREVRKGAYSGACNAYDYALGKKFVLFLNRVKDAWAVAGPAFSRINEEVGSENSPWVAAIRDYVRISAIQDYEKEKAALRRLQANARRNLARQPRLAGLIEDIDEHFLTPHPAKPYVDLMAIYDNGGAAQRRMVLWAFARGGHKEAAPLIRELLKSGEFSENRGPIAQYISRTADSAAIPDLAEAYLNITNKEARWPIMFALIRVAGRAQTPFMLDALKSADTEEAGRLAQWFVRFPNREATQIIRALVGGEYAERWELSFSLAGLGDRGVFEWASRIIQTGDKDRWMGLYVIARSPLPEADRLAIRVIQGNNVEDSLSLIEGYAESANPNRWARLRDLILLKGGNPEVKARLRRTLVTMASDGDTTASELLRSVR